MLIVAESPIGFRRWMIEYQLEKRFEVPHELGGVPSYALTKALFDKARDTLVVGRRPVPRSAPEEGAGGDPAAVEPAEAAAGPAGRDARQWTTRPARR